MGAPRWVRKMAPRWRSPWPPTPSAVPIPAISRCSIGFSSWAAPCSPGSTGQRRITDQQAREFPGAGPFWAPSLTCTVVSRNGGRNGYPYPHPHPSPSSHSTIRRGASLRRRLAAPDLGNPGRPLALVVEFLAGPPGSEGSTSDPIPLEWSVILARSSAVEHHLDTVGVGGSRPPAPTTNTLEKSRVFLFNSVI